MQEIYTDIVIDAPAEVVWTILTDLAAYGTWNPFILESAGQAVLGSTLTCRPRLPGSKKILTFHPKVTRVKPNKEFAWKGHVFLPGLADGEHIFEIYPKEDGRTFHVHRQEITGILSALVPNKIKQKTELGFKMMNQALKELAEKAVARD